MTRKKKTRSLKRIHQVKTGNIQKLKRAANHDRQTGKRVDKNKKVKSVYQKFLDENPEAKKIADDDQRKAAELKAKEAEKRRIKEQEGQKAEEKRPDREREEDIFDRFERGGQDDYY